MLQSRQRDWKCNCVLCKIMHFHYKLFLNRIIITVCKEHIHVSLLQRGLLMVIVLPTADIQNTTSSHRSTNKRSSTGTITHLIYNQLFHYILNLLPWLESWWFNGISLSSDSKLTLWFECAFKWESETVYGEWTLLTLSTVVSVW